MLTLNVYRDGSQESGGLNELVMRARFRGEANDTIPKSRPPNGGLHDRGSVGLIFNRHIALVG